VIKPARLRPHDPLLSALQLLRDLGFFIQIVRRLNLHCAGYQVLVSANGKKEPEVSHAASSYNRGFPLPGE